jgi:agmatine/peptidylarginine deiminase
MNFFVPLRQNMSNKAENRARRWRLPAEWEPQWGVQLTWPHADTDWAPILNDIIETYHQMAREIAKRERLIVVAPKDAARDMLRFVCPTDDTWARDHGFITLTDDEGHHRLLDYRFNGWGEKFPADNDNAINRRMYEAGIVEGEYTDCLDFVLEGGSIESDGKGTIFTTTGCLMAPHRNQPLTKEEIETRLKHDLCAERIVWIDHGQLTGDDTDGHIDTLVRICPDDTLVYVGCDDPDDEQYAELQLMEEQLKTLRTLEGQPYRLLKLPMPHPIFDEGYKLPATYANFLILNGAVLCPTYGQPDLDNEAIRIISEAFPDREMVPIDSQVIIKQHGSVHCCTMQFPKN